MGENCLLFINDLDMTKSPSYSPKKYVLALGSKPSSGEVSGIPSITGEYHPHSNNMQVYVCE